MLDAALLRKTPSAAACPSAPERTPDTASGDPADLEASRRTATMLALVSQVLAPRRRVVHAGDVIYPSGARFSNLFLLNTGFIKIVKLAADGRKQVVGLKFRGDWLGLDGIAEGRYACDAVAMDTGEIWAFGYDALLASCPRHPALLTVLHQSMSREIGRDRDSLMSVCTLPADARVAEFLRRWSESLSQSGLRADQITLRMTRAEIGNHLGMTLESVSRALSKLARDQVIAFAGTGRRDIRIPDVHALSAFVQRCLSPVPTLQ